MQEVSEVLEFADGATLRIMPDPNPPNPRESDNLGKMICWHSRYNLGDRHDFATPQDFHEWEASPAGEGAEVLPLYLLDHSGITMSTKPFSCRWDSGCVGFISVTKTRILQEYGEDTKEVRARVREVLRNEVATYDKWLRGDTWGYALFGPPVTCDKCGHTETPLLDSCYGFFGSDHEASGMFDNLPDPYGKWAKEGNYTEKEDRTPCRV